LPFVALVAADNVSRFGDLMTAVVIPWFVLETTGSAGKTGIVVFAVGLAVVISLFGGGAIVDRVGYRRMSILGDAASGATVASIAILHQLDALPFAVLVALTFLGTLLDLPAQMGRYAALPDAAGGAGIRFERANSIYEGVMSTGALVAPATAGFLIAGVGPANVLWFDVATFAISMLIVAVAFPIPVPGAEGHEGPKLPLRRALSESWSLVRRDEVLFPLVAYLFLVNLVIGPVETLVIPVYASTVLDSAIALGLMAAALAVGGLGGNVVFGIIGHRLPRQATFAVAFVALPAALVILAAEPGVGLALPVLAGLGLGLSIGNLLEYTIYFERIPAHIRASVLGICGGLTWLSVPIGRIAVGGLLEIWSLDQTLVAVAAVAAPLVLVVLVLRGIGVRSATTTGG
jgi:MFS family permease